MSATLDAILSELRACRVCRDAPRFGSALPHEPRPVIQASATARLLIAGQAPGTRVHASGVPFTDPSGDRLRDWLGLDEERFYDVSRVAVVPMGHCFPGLDAKGGDLPPRRECAPLWRKAVLASMTELRLILAIGAYAQRWHLEGEEIAGGVSETVSRWREIVRGPRAVPVIPLPHPSWRNNAWIRARPWFANELLPFLRERVAESLRPLCEEG